MKVFFVHCGVILASPSIAAIPQAHDTVCIGDDEKEKTYVVKSVIWAVSQEEAEVTVHLELWGR